MDPNNGDLVDRLSKIPDHLLDHIFYFLDTKDVVKTSILSKRWKFAWTSSSSLDFTYSRSGFKAKKLFSKFVSRVLHYHRNSPIKKFAFRWCSRSTAYTFPSLNPWISSVLDRNVQELIIDGKSGLQLPPCLFTSRTLVVLKLNVGISFNIPLDVDLPKIKTLSLENMEYVDESMQRLFSSCPVLEELEIVSKTPLFNPSCKQIISISIPSLKRLVIRVSERPIDTRCPHEMVLTAPNLESLELAGNVSGKFSIRSSSDCFVRACIQGSCASKVVKEIAQVNMLTLSKSAIEDLNAASGSILPVFGNITSLKLEIFDVADQNLISNLLINCPRLEVVSFSRVCKHLNEGGDSGRSPWNPPQSPPDCLSNLKRVEFHNFCGTTFEETLVRYILEHTPVHCKMTIYLPNIDDDSKDRTMLDQMIMQLQIQRARDAILCYQTSPATPEVQFRETKVTRKRKYQELLN